MGGGLFLRKELCKLCIMEGIGLRFEKVSQKVADEFCKNSTTFCGLRAALDKIQMPSRSTGLSAGYDFCLPFDCTISAGESLLIPTFFKVQLDADKVLEVYPRSSLGIKRGLMLANTVGIIDADYYGNPDNEGHIMICLQNMSSKTVKLQRGERFCQGIIKQYFLVEGDEYGVGAKRTGGIGSSGN